MFLAQARLTRGMHVVGFADLDVERAKRQLQVSGWLPEAMVGELSRRRPQERGHAHYADAAALMHSPGSR